MRDSVLRIYRTLLFTPMANRNIAWLDALIQQFPGVSGSAAIDVVMSVALHELKRIRVFMLDAREFPELDILPPGVVENAPLIVSFLKTEPVFIQGGLLYVLREFVYPITKFHFSLSAATRNLSFLEFLLEHDPELIELIPSLRRLNIAFLIS